MSAYDYLPYRCTYTICEVENGLIAHWQSESGTDETYVWKDRDALCEDIKEDIAALLDTAEREGPCVLTRYKISIAIERSDKKGGAA